MRKDGIMSKERATIQDAINSALKSSNRALKLNNFNKVAEIYFRIAYMLNELGDEEGAQNFATAAKEFKVKNQIIIQINEAMKKADNAFADANFAAVADNYFMISNLADLLGDKDSAEKYKAAAFKFQDSMKGAPQIKSQRIPNIGQYITGIQSHIPSSIKLKTTPRKGASGEHLNLDEALKSLGLVCAYCGKEIDPDLAQCPNCKRPI